MDLAALNLNKGQGGRMGGGGGTVPFTFGSSWGPT